MAAVRYIQKRFCRLLSAVLIWLIGAVPIAEAKSRAEATALWVLNLERFIEWPDRTSSNLVISVMGDEEMASQLRTFLNRSSKTNQIKVQSFKSFSRQPELLKSSILFTSQSITESHNDILKFLHGASVFTISDSPFYVELGGIMSLELQQGSISYSLNRHSATAKEITIRSALLGRANRVIDQPFLEVAP